MILRCPNCGAPYEGKWAFIADGMLESPGSPIGTPTVVHCEDDGPPEYYCLGCESRHHLHQLQEGSIRSIDAK